MVDVMGHFAMALLWASPAWIVWDGRVSLAFVGFALATAMLPDVDLVLQGIAGVDHHGVTHTVVFVLGVALIAGAVVEYGLHSRLERAWSLDEGDALSSRSLFAFAFSAFAVGGLSHVFADMLSAPDIAQAVEPLWPLYRQSVGIDLIWYNSVWWNAGLLAVALALTLVLASVNFDVDHPFRIDRESR